MFKLSPSLKSVLSHAKIDFEITLIIAFSYIETKQILLKICFVIFQW